MGSFAEINQSLKKFILSLDVGSSYSLERIEQLLKELGSPQEKFRVVHIAGTSGKTSTAYYVAAILVAAGYKTGLSVSPHLDEVNDRAQVNLTPLPEKEFCRELNEFIKILNTLSIAPTYFEFFVAFAFWYFAKIKVDYAVIEVGLGGLLDGSNVISREDKICTITDIGLDHTRVLGDTLSEIAAQKAGIIQKNNQVFMYKQADEIMQVINNRAKAKNAIIHIAENKMDPLVRHLPPFQQRNWSLARTICEYIFGKNNKKLTKKQWLATSNITVPGRLEILKINGKTLVLDGAHNVQKMTTFIGSYQDKFPTESTATLLAIAKGRDVHIENMAKEINKISNHIIISAFGVDQDVRRNSIDADIVARNFSGQVEVEPNLKKAISRLLGRKEDVLLITGSLYLVGAARKILRAQKI